MPSVQIGPGAAACGAPDADAEGAVEADGAGGVVDFVDSAEPPPHATAKRRANEKVVRMMPFFLTLRGLRSSRSFDEIARSR